MAFRKLLIYLCPIAGTLVFITTPGWVIGFLGEGGNTTLSMLGILAVFLYGAFGFILPIGYWKTEKTNPPLESLEKVSKVASVIAAGYMLPLVVLIFYISQQ